MLDIRSLMDDAVPAPGVILRAAPAAGEEGHLARQVLGVANARVPGPRAIVVGAGHGAGGRPVALGLTLSQIDELRAQLARIQAAIEPALQLDVHECDVEGVLLAVVSPAASDNPPYLAARNAPATLQPGECWLYEDRHLRPVTRADLDAMYAANRRRHEPMVRVGLGDDPHCECLDIRLPTQGVLPSDAAAAKLQAAISARKTVTEVLGRDDTTLGRLADARVFGPDQPCDVRGIETLRQSLRTVRDELRDADLHHRFERAAIRVNLSLLAATDEPLRDVMIDLILPELPGLAVATGVVPPPGAVADQRGYPEVLREQGRVRVRARLRELAASRPTAAFRQPLRLAVDAAFAGQKLAVRYAVHSPSLPAPIAGRLRLRFVS